MYNVLLLCIVLSILLCGSCYYALVLIMRQLLAQLVS